MKTRTRRLALLAAGAGAALVPLTLATPAGASQTHATSQARLTFVDFRGATVTCTVTITATHDTDNANQPKTIVQADVSGANQECDQGEVTVFVNYKDKSGVSRSSSFDAVGAVSGTIAGTYPAISTSAQGYWGGCDSTLSASCDVTAVASPK